MTVDINRLREYVETGEIRTGLLTEVSIAMVHLESAIENNGKPQRQFSSAYAPWIPVISMIHADIQAISLAAKRFELRHWTGLNENDTKFLMSSYRKWSYSPYRYLSEEEKTQLRGLWNPDPTRRADAWKPFLGRRRQDNIQETYNSQNSRYLKANGTVLDQVAATSEEAAFVHKHIKINIGSMAGRVCMEFEDRIDRKSEDNVFDGARVTLIFDETSDNPRGGIQGLAATRDEAVGMLEAVTKWMPTLG